MKLDSWTANQTIGESDWTTVYSLSATFTHVYGFILHASTSLIHIKVEYPGVVWEMDLNEIASSYHLDAVNMPYVPRWLVMLDPDRFSCEFPEFIRLQGTFLIKLKTHSGQGDKTLYRGFTSLAVR